MVNGHMLGMLPIMKFCPLYPSGLRMPEDVGWKMSGSSGFILRPMEIRGKCWILPCRSFLMKIHRDKRFGTFGIATVQKAPLLSTTTKPGRCYAILNRRRIVFLCSRNRILTTNNRSLRGEPRRLYYLRLHSQEELHQEQGGDDIGQNGHILELAAEDLDDGVGD